jgi:transposase InsO family protein
MVHGRQVTVPLRPRPRSQTQAMVNVIALDDGNFDADPSATRLGTDPNLEVPSDQPIDEATEALFKQYQIIEPTLTLAQKLLVLKVLQANEAVFAKGATDLGLCTVGEHVIDTGDATPINTPPHAMAHHLRPILRAELDELLELGIIEPSDSEWAAPIVYVKKKDGTWRLCVDFRKVNAVARVCVYPLPRINDVFTVLQGSRYFSTLDLAKGFWQIKLDDASKHKTGFTTVYGQYQFKRLPFGLATSPGAFQHAMNTVLSGLNWVHCMVYIDDVLIFTKDFESHLEYLDQVLKRLAGANLKVKAAKCEFVRTECHYLGHKLNSLGMMPDPSKVEAIASLTLPRGLKELETFLGKVVYYGRFIDHLSSIAKPLFDLKRKKAVWKFDEAEIRAFEQLRTCLITVPVLRHPNFEKEFLVQTDASGYGLGAVLAQEFEDGEHPIAYASRTLQDAETRYAVIEREGLALQWGINHFQAYLLGAEFVAFTDHKPLVSLMTKDQCNKRLQNYALKLQHFKFTIRYRPGSENVSADFLSRIDRYPKDEVRGKRVKSTQVEQNEVGVLVEPVPPPKPRKEPKMRTKRVGTPAVRLLARHQMTDDPAVIAALWSRIPALQREDYLFGWVIRYLTEGTLPADDEETADFVVKLSWHTCMEQDRTLRYISQGRTLLCVPPQLRRHVMTTMHEAPQSGHLGIAKTHARLTTQYWWPRVAQDVAKWVRSCPLCLAHKAPHINPRAPLGSREIPRRVWQRVHLDVWSAGGASERGNLHVIAFVDSLSKFVIATPSADHTALTIVDTFLTSVEATFGLPEELVTDGAPEFRSLLFQQLFRATGLTRTIVSPYRPHANGQVERFFKTLRPVLAALANERPQDWDLISTSRCPRVQYRV